jgi:hypothetical protein
MEKYSLEVALIIHWAKTNNVVANFVGAEHTQNPFTNAAKEQHQTPEKEENAAVMISICNNQKPQVEELTH